jgi:hypothetical protein
MDAERLFTYTQRLVIERLRKDLSRRILRPITVIYWAPSDRLVGIASFCIEGAGRDAGPLASILTGPGIAGEGYAVDAGDGSPLAEGVSFAHAEQVARLAALYAHRNSATPQRRALTPGKGD